MNDDLGTRYDGPRPATRVVSLVPSLTETLASVGREWLVGATEWCTHPPDLDVARVRGTKNPDLAAIRGLEPDVVIANKQENRELDVRRLRDSGVRAWVTDTQCVPDALSSIERLLAALSWDEPEWLHALHEFWCGPLPRVERRVAVPIWRDPWMVVGSRTFTGDLLRRLGWENVYADHPERYPHVDLEEIDTAGADVVLLPDEPYVFTSDDGPEAFTRTPTELVSGRLITWYGPSLVEAARLTPAEATSPFSSLTSARTDILCSVTGGQRVDEQGDTLTLAQRAYASRDWPTAVTHFDAVDSEHFTADDLAAYADAVWWVGRVDDKLRLGAAACDAFEAEARPAEAAMTAFSLGVCHLARGEEEQSRGWLGRAGRLVAGLPEGPVHGHLMLFTEVEGNLLAGRPAAALDAARRGQEIGRRYNDAGLLALGLQSEGRALIQSGHMVDGLPLLDAAMVSVQNGQIDPFLSGVLYCHTVAACHRIADVRRMVRWTELTEQWLATLPAAVFFEGLCAVHRAQLRLLHGEWDEAERSALRIAKDFDRQRVDYAAEAWYVVAEVRRLRGDPDAADAYDEAHARGRDPQPGRALLRIQQGDAAGAATSVRSALTAAGDDPLRRAPICAAAVDIALTAGRLEEAAAATSELAATAATYATSGLETMACAARGTVLLAEGRAEEALPVLREACRRWHDLGAWYDAARTCVRLADAYRALGDGVSAAAELDRAHTVFDQLGAYRPAPESPDGLTRRECEVLALVANGRSNREIAETLVISDRTVARHLTNIFHKIGVSSRTQAARYALDHGVTASR